ncbi:lysine N(6)-hydroxylase/L-ornithine N(5)-oxygenase family protein [Streptomyces sp. NPDC087440]|uniref:lysine N(6)-hydroxylase/L-ornithine N(5)-oxygenase family protein n=1 Tax=Streptomyces sp. NPDC087440 TaxID=3365790 RepID=UPI00381E94F2
MSSNALHDPSSTPLDPLSDHRIHDVIGIGFGPANLALAIALEEENTGLDALFLESSAAHTPWQSGMMLPGSDIQNHPVRDLVSLRNPRSRYSFINFLFENGRLLDHLNLPTEFPLRKEYAQYIDWVAGHFADRVEYGTRVTEVEVVPGADGPLHRVTDARGRQRYARTLVVGTGRTPYIPAPFDTVDDPRVCHLTRFLPTLDALPGTPRRIAVVGGSQSAVELTLDLSHRFPDAQITVWARSYALREKDTSPFSEEGYFPQFTAYYHRASRDAKRTLDAYMRPTNYAAADGDVLRELYVKMYEQRLDGDPRIRIRGNRQLTDVQPGPDGVRLAARETVTGETEEDHADLVVLATGFRDLGPGERQDRFPRAVAALADRFAYDADGHLRVRADYLAEPVDATVTPPLFLNGLCESTHGIGDAGSFSLLSLRAATLAGALREPAAPAATGSPLPLAA